MALLQLKLIWTNNKTKTMLTTTKKLDKFYFLVKRLQIELICFVSD
jgi:hypothetical protein